MMTLALLVTAASAWADDVLNIVVDGTSATIKYDGNASNNPYLSDTDWEQDGNDWDMADAIRPNITTVTIDGSCKNFSGTSLHNLFLRFSGLTTINGLDNLNTANVQDMEYMFADCSSLTSLDLSSLNTASVTTMFSMFNGCSKLTTVDLSGWNTENVKKTNGLFSGCSELTTVDLSSFNTAKVQNMSYMFLNCSKLENIYVGDGWSTAAVTNGNNMFKGCSKLPNWNGTVTHAMAKLSTEGGYLQKKPEGIELAWDAATRTATLDEMPEGNVVVDVEYYSWAGVTLNVTGQTQGGTAKLLKKLDDGSFADMTDEDKVREEREFILMVDKEDGYDFKVPDMTIKEFTEDEYVAYYNWAKDNDINVPLTSALLWVTMPHVDSGNLNLTVNFQQMLTYTLLYQPASGQNPDVVACKMERSVKGTPEVSYMAMRRGASMGDGTAVWTTTMQAAYGPTKVAFVPVTTEADLETALNSAAMSGATISQNADSWTTLNDAKYLIIGGNAKVVTAAFVADGNAVTTYKDFQVDEATPSEGGVQYQLAVCLTDAQGNVTTAGTVKAPAAPAPAQGMKFDGWRGYAYDGNGRLVEQIFKKGDDVSLRGNMTLNAIWSPQQITTTFALNGGANFDGSKTVDYGQKLSVSGEPTRSGLVFDKWTVTKAVNESGILFGRGSQFDMNTALTANLSLNAQWKHVHEYTCYTISRFGDALKNYQKYNGVLHIAVCGCNDVEIVEHEFNPAGKCACGYEKPGATKVQLDIAYGKLEGTTYTNFANGFPEFPMKGQEVKVEAFHNWGDLEFKTWQYSTDNGASWEDLAAFEIVGFLIPCDMKVRAIYVNPVTTPTIELATSEGTDQTVYQGQTYKMGNILYQMNYKLPDGYKLLDAGIRMGDNSGISYYFEQTVRYSYDAESKGIIAGINVGLAGLGMLTGGVDLMSFVEIEKASFDKAYEIRYLEREENVMVQEKMAPATLAKKMYESIPINVKKYDPIYWEAQAPTKGNFGSMATMPPLRFAQKNNQDHYIYGIAYMRYKTPAGEMKVLYTDALAPTVNHPDGHTMKQEQPSGARLMHFADDLVGATTAAATTAAATTAAATTAAVPAVSPAGPASAARKAPKREPEQQQPEQLDLSTITAPQTQLVVYVDGEYSGQLSDTYGYNETVSLTAPNMDGKTFSYWTTDDGTVIPAAATLTITMKANTTLRAVYGAAAVPAASPAALTSVTRTNDGKSIVLNAISAGSAEGAGFIYSTTATGDNLTIGVDGVTQIAAVKYTNMGNTLPASVIDKNNCWSAQITPDEADADAIYHVRAYTTNGGTTTYSEVKDVKLSTLKSGLMMVANIAAFENNLDTSIDDLLTQLQTAGQLPAGYAIEVAAGEYATFYCDKAVTLSAETAANAQLYTITAVSNDKATATAMTVAAANTPLLVKNTTESTQTVLLMPTDNAADNVTAAPEFVGTLEDATIAASTDDQANYAFNGKQFVYVLNDLSVSANKAWLAIPMSTARQISIVFGDATAILAVGGSPANNSSLYTLDGRKVANGQWSMVNGQLKKGVYIMNGKKVVVR